MEYSKYQKAVFDEIVNGISNIVIEASAGSAKTTTIVKSLDFIPNDKKILFIAFNKEIVSELKEKIGERKNITICTMHSLGRDLLRQNGYSIEVEENKYQTFIRTNESVSDIISQLKPQDIGRFTHNIISLTSLCRNFMARTIKQIRAVADRYSITYTRGEDKIVKEALSWGMEHLDCIDFDDMIWLPNVKNLNPKYVKYDFIFLDEAQDANNAQIELFLRYRQKGTRMVTVGDKNQSIYNFRGVDGSTFDKLKSMPNTKSLPLSISYRCPKKVVEFAKKFSDNIEPYEKNEEGEINYKVNINDITDNSMVLCRTNAPLMFLFFNLLNSGKKAFILGNENIFGKITSFANEIEFDNLELNRKKDGFIPQLYKLLFDKKDDLCSEFNLTETQVYCGEYFRSQYDVIQSVEVLSIGLKTKQELLERIERIKELPNVGIRLSTIHKSKGLESDDVFILCPSLMPSRFAKLDWEIEEERHIQYVAFTRCKKTLNFINEADFGDFTENKNDYLERINRLEQDINKLTNRQKHIVYSLGMTDEDFADKKISSASTQVEKSEPQSIEYNTNNIRRRRR